MELQQPVTWYSKDALSPLILVGPETEPTEWVAAAIWDFQVLSELYRTAAIAIVEVHELSMILTAMAARECAPADISESGYASVILAASSFLSRLRNDKPEPYLEARANVLRLNKEPNPLSRKLAILIGNDTKVRRSASAMASTYIQSDVGLPARSFIEGVEVIASDVAAGHPNPPALIKRAVRGKSKEDARKERRRKKKVIEAEELRLKSLAEELYPLRSPAGSIADVVPEVDWARAKAGLGSARNIKMPADLETLVESRVFPRAAAATISWSPHRLEAARKALEDPDRKYSTLLRERFDSYRETRRKDAGAYISESPMAPPSKKTFNPDAIPAPQYKNDSQAKEAGAFLTPIADDARVTLKPR